GGEGGGGGALGGAGLCGGGVGGGGRGRGLRGPGGGVDTRRELDELAVMARGAGGGGLAWLPGGPLDKFVSPDELQAVQEATGAGPDGLVLIAADRPRRAEKGMGLLRSEVARRRHLIREGGGRVFVLL